jgi:hypothetical protein
MRSPGFKVFFYKTGTGLKKACPFLFTVHGEQQKGETQ